MTLLLEASFLCTPTRARGTTHTLWLQCFGQALCHSFECSLPIPGLGPRIIGDDAKTRTEFAFQPISLVGVQRFGIADLEDEFRSGIRRVGVLASRPPGRAEPPGQLGRRDAEGSIHTERTIDCHRG